MTHSSIGVLGSEVEPAERSMGEYTETSQDNSKLVTIHYTKKFQPTREREREKGRGSD